MKKVAFITGLLGQDGSYLANFLIEKGYSVHGLVRRSSSVNFDNLRYVLGDKISEVELHEGDLCDAGSLVRILSKIKPDEIYNLGAQSHVGSSFEQPEYTANVNALGVLRLLESLRSLGLLNTVRVYQASTSELYGMVQEVPQSEKTPFYPRSPYAISKLFGFWTVVNYREAYGAFACNGILFNHESPIRGYEFVTRKITSGLARVKLGLQEFVELGNLDARRDWGHAKDYVRMQWMMLQAAAPDDYVIATGVQHSVREFVEKVCLRLGMDLQWQGEGVEELGISNGVPIIKVSPRFYREAEVETLLGCADKAVRDMGWAPKLTLDELIDEMVSRDLGLAEFESLHGL